MVECRINASKMSNKITNFDNNSDRGHMLRANNYIEQ